MTGSKRLKNQINIKVSKLEEFNGVLKDRIYNKLLCDTENKEIKEILREYKKFCDLYSYIVKPEKIGNNLVLNKIYYHDYVSFSLSAIYWKVNRFLNYEKISVQEESGINNISRINYKQLKYRLLAKIYWYVIKNKIMMI